MELDEETQKKVQELQFLEQNFQMVLMQKQSMQIEFNETKTALEEVGKSKGDIFKVLGQVMVKADKDALKKELKEKKEILEKHMKSFEKQELSLRENVERLRSEIVSKIQ